MEITAVKVISPVKNSGWTQIFERDNLYLLIASPYLGKDNDSLTLGRECFARFSQEYYGKAETGIFSALKNACQKIYQEYSVGWGKVEIAAAVILEKTVYSAAAGGAKIMIHRGGMLATILASSSEEEVVIASGYPQEGDDVIGATSGFCDTVPEGALRNLLNERSISSVHDKVLSYLTPAEIVGTCGAFFLNYSTASAFSLTSQFKVVSSRLPKLNLISGVKSVTERLLGSVKKTRVFRSDSGDRNIFLKKEFDSEEKSRGRNLPLVIGSGLLLILLVSIVWGIRQKQITAENKQFQEQINNLRHLLEEAEGLKGLDDNRAHSLVSEGERILEKLKERKNTTSEVDSLALRLEADRREVLGEYRVTPALFLDLGLQTAGFKGEKIAVSGDNLFILDKGGRRIIGTTVSGKKTKVTAGPDQVSETEDLAVYNDRTFVLEGEGIYEVGNCKQKMINGDWSGESFMAAYAGNIYVLNKSGGAIWRFAGDGEQFGVKQKWLAAGISPDFSQVTGIALDGAIWVLENGGKVTRYSLGVPHKFGFSGMPGNPDFTAIYTNEELRYLYLLDNDGGRVVVTDKDGNFKAEYLDDKIKEAVGLVVSEKEGKIILLAGAKLMSIEIRHL